MGYIWTFDTDFDGWDWGFESAWGTSIYRNAPGAPWHVAPEESEMEASNFNTEVAGENGGDFLVHYRVKTDTTNGTATYTVSASINYSDLTNDTNTATGYITTTDTGWLSFTVTGNPAKTVSSLSLNAYTNGFNNTCLVYFDDLYFDEEEPVTETGLRLLGMVADGNRLYATEVLDNTLRLVTYDKTTLTNSATATFGTLDFAAPDAYTGGLYPVTRPGADAVVYAYGLDANSKSVWYKTGTEDWADITPGTATPIGFCAALMPNPLTPTDMLAIGYGGTIARDLSGTGDWATGGSLLYNVTAGVRYPTRPEQLMLAGTAAGTLLYSPNSGASATLVGGTALGTINWIEVNR